MCSIRSRHGNGGENTLWFQVKIFQEIPSRNDEEAEFKFIWKKTKFINTVFDRDTKQLMLFYPSFIKPNN